MQTCLHHLLAIITAALKLHSSASTCKLPYADVDEALPIEHVPEEWRLLVSLCQAANPVDCPTLAHLQLDLRSLCQLIKLAPKASASFSRQATGMSSHALQPRCDQALQLVAISQKGPSATTACPTEPSSMLPSLPFNPLYTSVTSMPSCQEPGNSHAASESLCQTVPSTPVVPRSKLPAGNSQRALAAAALGLGPLVQIPRPVQETEQWLPEHSMNFVKHSYIGNNSHVASHSKQSKSAPNAATAAASAQAKRPGRVSCGDIVSNSVQASRAALAQYPSGSSSFNAAAENSRTAVSVAGPAALGLPSFHASSVSNAEALHADVGSFIPPSTSHVSAGCGHQRLDALGTASSAAQMSKQSCDAVSVLGQENAVQCQPSDTYLSIDPGYAVHHATFRVQPAKAQAASTDIMQSNVDSAACGMAVAVLKSSQCTFTDDCSSLDMSITYTSSGARLLTCGENDSSHQESSDRGHLKGLSGVYLGRTMQHSFTARLTTKREDTTSMQTGVTRTAHSQGEAAVAAVVNRRAADTNQRTPLMLQQRLDRHADARARRAKDECMSAPSGRGSSAGLGSISAYTFGLH